MPINARAKGNRNELKAKKILEAAGYDVEKKVHTVRSPGDFFGLFDVIAVNGVSWRLIQCKTNARETPVLREAIKLFPVPSNTSKEVWVFYDNEPEPIIHIL